LKRRDVDEVLDGENVEVFDFDKAMKIDIEDDDL